MVSRETLAAGTELVGPVIIEELHATSVVPPDARARIDARGLLVIEVRG